jgi:signal transduction histidine kinase
MVTANLKSILKKEAASLITDFINTLGAAIAIEDSEGKLLLGETDKKDSARIPVKFGDAIVGYVSGEGETKIVADLLEHLVVKETDKKTLGNEVLSLYREINLIYNFSEKLAVSLEISQVGEMALEEATQLIRASGGTVLLLSDKNLLKPVASFGNGIQAKKGIKAGEGIIGNIVDTGNAEIINDVHSDPRLSDKEKAMSSLICSPLKVKKEVKGVIVLGSETPLVYTAAELRLLTTVASQAALAIENAILHEKMVQEATRKIEARRKELEMAVQERTAELRMQKENIELLSEIGKEITASLEFETIFSKLYEHLNHFADATIFGVGIYHPEEEQIEYRLAIEKGTRYKPYTRDARNKNQFPVWCIENRKPVFINDVEKEYKNYFKEYKEITPTLENGSVSKEPLSLIYLPLIAQERVLGIITIQSYKKSAYTEDHLNLLQNLATYTSIALDNSNAYRQLNATLENLKATQQQLIVQEKLASLGQLTAGIAHEIKNPLNFVNNFADLSVELVAELREAIEKQKKMIAESEYEDFLDVLENLESNAKKINEHGKRADSIVHSMLQHSRGQAGEREETDINAMLEEDLNLAYHGMRARDSSFNVTMETNFDKNVGKLTVVPQNISRAFLNIITNGFYELNRKKQENGDSYEPTILVSSANKEKHVEIRIRDNGDGIPEHIRDKLFNPFFTTKPTGQGTGLGLSLSFDIIAKEHQGDITFESKEGEYTEFIITLPKNGK